MVWARHHMIDPSEIESRFAIEDGMAYMASIFEEPSDEAKKQICRVLEILDVLPPREADFIELYYFKRLKQTDIAAIFAVSQPTVSYRLQRATARIQFILQMPCVCEEALKEDLRLFLTDPLDVEIMVLMKQTTCQSEVAKVLGVSQGLVRHRFIRSLGRMRGIGGFEDYVRLFEFIAANLNILREVQRPVWDSQVTHTVN
ncbi:MAG: sigma-70 family RNA polymerase sigma factor [Planctomycetota bacterium]|jgi:DNA-directed RNA polymerase specialized sigma subunit